MSRFLHVNATRLMKGFKASIHDESTTAIVSEGHCNHSESPVSGNVEANPFLGPHGPLAPSDPAGREALLALSPEVRPPYLYLSVNSDSP